MSRRERIRDYLRLVAKECHRMGKFVTKESFLSSNTDRVMGEMQRSRMDWCITHDDDASSGQMVRFATITALRNLSKSSVTARA